MRTLIAITTCAKNRERREAVRETWMPLVKQWNANVEARFVVGVRPDDDGADTVCLDCPDTYEELPQKTYRLVEYAYLLSGYDAVIKADDDTFFVPSPENITEFAKHDCLAHVRQSGPYPQGGCYSLSRTAMKAVLAHPELFTTGLEDAAVGKALAAEGIALTHTARIMTTHLYGTPHPRNRIISAHCCPPCKMRDIMRLWVGRAGKMSKAKCS